MPGFSDIKKEGSEGKKRREETFSASLKTAMCQQGVNANDSPKAAMNQKRVDANAACMLTPQDKRPANATPSTVHTYVDAAEELSVTKQTRKKRLTS